MRVPDFRILVPYFSIFHSRCLRLMSTHYFPMALDGYRMRGINWANKQVHFLWNKFLLALLSPPGK